MISLVIPSLPGFERMNRECVESYQEMAKREVEVCLIEQSQPFAVNVNAGIKVAKGDVICVVNNDSLGLPGWDEWMERATKSHRGIGSFTPRADCGWAFGASRALFDEVGLLDENFCNSYEDYDFFIRAALKGYTRVLAPKHYAVHTGGVSLETVWGHNRKQSAARLEQCKANRAYAMSKWPDLNVDAVPFQYWAFHGVEIMKEWAKAHAVDVEAP